MTILDQMDEIEQRFQAQDLTTSEYLEIIAELEKITKIFEEAEQ